MTGEEESLGAALQSADRIAVRFERSLERLGQVFPVEAASLEASSDQDQLEIDAFLKRFEQLQDTATRRIFRLTLILSGENVSGWSARDATTRMEALGAIDDAAAWFETLQVRNRLAHQYPADGDKRVEQLNDVWTAALSLKAQWPTLRAFAAQMIAEEI